MFYNDYIIKKIYDLRMAELSEKLKHVNQLQRKEKIGESKIQYRERKKELIEVERHVGKVK
ncbi:hypothetical protein PB1_05872 [Bacillus methanolicus PB1]|uniref:Uncharacterized protein n=1 Tax=Bacillus methanolicus PB1 TaxID=997296 RepID=I3E048_BACMT|nr:hypothetical protein [Bacillus methanolicus]EIJ79869.1 hypothetical protein PB1_05872 [Bacillus methanolicus PB1]